MFEDIKLRYLRGFTLVEVMIVVAILGTLIALGVPGFLTARNHARKSSELANLKCVTDRIALYGVSEVRDADIIIRLWPASSTTSDPNSYIRRQLFCPVSGAPYVIDFTSVAPFMLGSCTDHGDENIVQANP